MNTIMCSLLTRNVKHRVFFLQKLNNGCDFVALLRIYLEYHGWFESYAAQPLKSELSGAAKMEAELSPRA